MKTKKLLALILCISVIASTISANFVFASAQEISSKNYGQSPVTVFDFTSRTNKSGGFMIGGWHCGNGDAALHPFAGWGLGGVWGHISINRENDSLVLKNNGEDGNPAVLRYTLGANNVGTVHQGTEIPVNSYLEITATATENFNLVIPFYYDSVANNGSETGFITLRQDEQGNIFAFNSSSADAYACTTIISNRTISVKIPLYNILTDNGTRNVSVARIYSLDYLANPNVRAYTTAFSRLAITTDSFNIADYSSNGVNGETDMYKWYKDEFEGSNYFGHMGWCVNPINSNSMSVTKSGNALIVNGNSSSDFLRLKFSGKSYGIYPSTITLDRNSYLNYSLDSNKQFRIAFHILMDKMSADSETWKMRSIYLKDGGNGKLVADVKGLTENSSYVGDLIPAGVYSGYGIDLSNLLAGGDSNIKNAQLFAVSIWTEETSEAKLTINELSIGKATDLLQNVTYGESNVKIDRASKKVTIDLPYSADVTSIEPIVSIDSNATIDKTGPQDFTNPVTYTISKNGISQTYTVSVNKILPDGAKNYYLFDPNPANWFKAQGSASSKANLTFKENSLNIENSGSGWINTEYIPLKNTDEDVYVNSDTYLYYDLSSTAEYWNVTINLKDNSGKTSVIDLNKYLAYKKGRDENIFIPDGGGYINYRTNCSSGSWTGKIALSDLIVWAKTSGVFDSGDMMVFIPTDCVLYIDNIVLHCDNGGKTGKNLFVRTLAFDDAKGSNLNTRMASKGKLHPKLAPNNFRITNPDSAAALGEITYVDNVLSIQKATNGWVNFMGPLTRTANINKADAVLNLNYIADDVHRLYITLTNDKCESLKINITQYLASLSSESREYMIGGTYVGDYLISDLINFQCRINGTNPADFSSANGTLTVSQIDFNMEGGADKYLIFNDFSFTTSSVDFIGDINDDGIVNLKDLIRFKKALADSSTEINNAFADLNKDLSINSEDLTLLKKYALNIYIF